MTTQSSWASGSLARHMVGHFRLGWGKLPRAARKRWMISIAAGIAFMFVLMFVLVQIGTAMVASGRLDWEPDFLRAVEKRAFGFSSAVWFQTFGTDITLWFLLLVTVGLSAWRGRPLSALSIILAYVVLDVVVRYGWASWARVRPDIIAQGIARPSFHSFPSGHTGKTLCIYGLLGYIWIRASKSWIERVLVGLIISSIALVVPLGRMRMGVHWPSDIMGGYILGLTWLGILIWALRNEKPILKEETPQD
jgi:undecaprenyl-diphosphatase